MSFESQPSGSQPSESESSDHEPLASPSGESSPQESPNSECDEAVAAVHRLFGRLSEQIRKVFVGQEELVEGTLAALLCGGHVLIESVPGLGKTLFVKTLGRVLGCDFGRIQFTADLMPADVTGSLVFNAKTQEFEFRRGPIFTQLLLADEINRSPAKTHAALLQGMQERSVTIDRETYPLERPFLVLATQNPLESEGVYSLPEAQLDRFMFKLLLDYPAADEELQILKLHGRGETIEATVMDQLDPVAGPQDVLAAADQCGRVEVTEPLYEYVNQLVRKTRDWPGVYSGASPRAGLSLVLGARALAAIRGRDFATPDDVLDVWAPALRHRVLMTAEAEVEGARVDDVLAEIARSVEAPRE